MDLFSSWLHNANIDRTLNRLGSYVDPAKRATLMKFLIKEEDQLGTDQAQLERTVLRVREGKARISRTLAIIQGLVEHDLMDEETFSKAMEVLNTIAASQALIEQRYRHILSTTSHPEN